MSKHRLVNRLQALHDLVTTKRENEVNSIMARYGNDPAKLVKYGSQYEKQCVAKWGIPRVAKQFFQFWPLFMPTVMKFVFEKDIYPLILRTTIEEEEAWTVFRLDLLYIRMVYPDLAQAAADEWNSCPSYTEDSDAWENWRLSPELARQLRGAHADLERIKATIRNQLRAHDKDDDEM